VSLRITAIRITPIAVQDPPLLNAVGVHEPFALRSIVEVDTDSGITGIGEAYGDDPTLKELHTAAADLIGLDVFDLNGLRARVAGALDAADAHTTTPLVGAASRAKTLAAVVAAFEVPCLDAQGKAVGRPVVDLLGGPVRTEVPYSAYLFYRWARHPRTSLHEQGRYKEDDWGEALDPEGIVAQARRMVSTYGFGSLKLKGGVFPPEQEIEAVLALRDAFPGHPLRIDPNANWTVPTGRKVAERLAGVLEYLEDPVGGVADMAEVARTTDIPLATNMCVTSMEELPEGIERRAVRIILSDHHFWGGLRATQQLAAVCETFGLGLSMHSNTHLGISLAAMTHLAAAVPGLTYACDTHSPWQHEDVIEPGAIAVRDGAIRVPGGPGLGVTIDRDALGRLHEQYLRCGVRRRDDVAAMRVVHPDWTGERPRW
jgi:glucarate dehydratase